MKGLIRVEKCLFLGLGYVEYGSMVMLKVLGFMNFVCLIVRFLFWEWEGVIVLYGLYVLDNFL